MLKVLNLTKNIRKRPIISDISFNLNKSSILAILGPSGSGKTSLLRMILGLDAATKGTISWDNQILSKDETVLILPEKRRFGMVFQEPALFPHLNVIQNVAFGLRSMNNIEKFKLAGEWLHHLSIEGLGLRRIDDLSGGELQRVALARALAPKPELLLLDEPFSSVDRLVRHELIFVLKSVLETTKTTVVFVTHDARDAVEFGTHMLILKSGELINHGKTEDIIKSPGSEWAEYFLSCGLGQEHI